MADETVINIYRMERWLILGYRDKYITRVPEKDREVILLRMKKIGFRSKILNNQHFFTNEAVWEYFHQFYESILTRKKINNIDDLHTKFAQSNI